MKQNFKTVIIIFVFSAASLVGVDTKAQIADRLIKKMESFGDLLLYRYHDTTYISSYGNEIAVKLLVVNKYNYFRIRDRINNSRLRYRPGRDLSMGVGLSYKWFALNIAFSLDLNKNSELENTCSFNFQGSLFSSKQYTLATIQYYQAYKLGNVAGADQVLNPDSERREDIRTITFALQYMYAFNYTKFSMKAPFVFNEVQHKSAGSPIVGASFNMFVLDADSSIVPSEVASSFDLRRLHMRDLNVLSAAISLGYMYTYVYREHFVLTLSLIPGLNFNSGDYYSNERNGISLNANFKLNSMNAIGYNGRRIFAGVLFFVDSYFSKIEKKLSAEIGYGKTSVFVGYRFVKKK